MVRELKEAVGEASDEFQVVIARAQDEAPVCRQFAERLQDRHLSGDRIGGSGQEVQDAPVHDAIDVVHGSGAETRRSAARPSASARTSHTPTPRLTDELDDEVKHLLRIVD